jgi:hypothetical protein
MTSESNAGGPARPEIIRAIPPGRDAWFRSVAPPTAQIRTARDTVETACLKCLKRKKEGVIELRKCSKVRYHNH